MSSPAAQAVVVAAATAPERRRWALLGPLALVAAALAPVRSWQQLLYAGSFAVAALGCWALGRGTCRALLKVPQPTPFVAAYVGELALLAAGNVITALGGLVAALGGRALPLVVPVAVLAGVMLARELAAWRREGGASPRLDLLTILGVGSLSLVLAIYARHLAAPGLDAHEHTAWVEQILRAGYVPLAEPGTRIVGDYPRTFHLLTALLAAAGLGPPSGPFVKVMPFLQTALPLLAMGELLVEASVRRAGGRGRAAMQVAVGAACFVYYFLLVPAVYPTPDLSGTPRLSSNALLLLPVMLVLLSKLEGSPAAAALAWAAWPLLGAWALTWNPIVPALLLAVGLPGLVVFSLALRPPLAAFGRWRLARWTALAALLGTVAVLQDPWVVTQWAARCAPCAAALRRVGGIITFDQAVREGTATAREKSVRNAQPQPLCSGDGCVSLRAWGAVREGAELPLRAARAAWRDSRALVERPSTRTTQLAFHDAVLPQPNALADHAALPYLFVLACGVVVAFAAALRRRRLELPGMAHSAGRLLAVSLAVCLVAGLLLSVCAALAGAFDDQTHDRLILDGYLHLAAFHVSLVLLGVPFLCASAVLAERFAPRAATATRAERPWRLRALGAGALALWVALPLAARLNLHQPIQQRGFWSRVDLADVAALHRLERLVPPEDAVLAPAEHWNIDQWEHWVIPVGPTTALLPYGERRYLFDVYLGASFPLSWRDLEDRLCSRDPSVHGAFLERWRARWLLVRDDRGRGAAEALDAQRMCGAPLAALGVELPPVAAERGIFLFRLLRP